MLDTVCNVTRNVIPRTTSGKALIINYLTKVRNAECYSAYNKRQRLDYQLFDKST
jgi:hypothetical protein